MQFSCPARSRMLVKEPERRISTQQIISHPWFQNNLPVGFMETNLKVNPDLHKQSEADICAVVREAQVRACCWLVC